MRATLPSRQRFSLFLLGFFVLICTGPRPVVHSHEELAASAPSSSTLNRHLSEFHEGLDPVVPEDSEVHLHWVFPSCECRQSSLEPQTGAVAFSAPADTVEITDTRCLLTWEPSVAPADTRAVETTRRAEYGQHRVCEGLLPAGPSLHDLFCLLTC